MVERLLQTCLTHRAAVLVLSAAVVAFGLWRGRQMPIDVFPDLTAPRVTIVTESTGFAAEDVERLITYPIESAVNGTAGVRRVRSASAPGISLVWVEFDWDTTSILARQRITERLQSVGPQLPDGTDPPMLAPASSVMGEIAFIALTAKDPKVTPMQLRRVAEVEVRRRLLGIEGIAQVVAIGGEEKQYQVLLDPHALGARRLTLDEVVRALEQGSRNAPGGFLVDRGRESVIRVLGQARNEEDLGAIVLGEREGVPIRVRDVGQVVAAPAVRRGTASYGAEPAVVLTISKQPEADTVFTSRRLAAVLGTLEQDLARQGIALRQDIFWQTDFITTAIHNVFRVLRDGTFLVVAVLFLFLWSFRPTVISLTAIPVSMVTATLTLDALGMSLDTMTLGGLAIAVGELVDDAIVDVENVVRRLRETRHDGPMRPSELLPIVLRASLEVRTSIVSATYIVILVFVPLFFLDGIEGRLMRPLAVTYVVAILASLVVALTLTPVLCSLLLGPRRVARPSTALGSRTESPVMAWLERGFGRSLHGAVARPRTVGAVTLLGVIAGFAGLAFAGQSFLPEFNEGNLTIGMVLPPGTSLEESDTLGTLAERALLADPGVIAVARRTGRAERDEHVQGVEASEFEVRVRENDPRTKAQLLEDVRQRLRVVSGADFTLGQPISHRIEHMLSGQRTSLSIKIYGENLVEVIRAANQVATVARGVPGLADVSVEQVANVPEWRADVDPERAAEHGFSTGEAASAIGTALWGREVAQVYEEGTATKVVVRYPASWTTRGEQLERTPIPTPHGALVPLSALAHVREDRGPNYVLRENVARRVVVTANVVAQDSRAAIEVLRERVAKEVKLPPKAHLAFAGAFEREAAATSRLFVLGALALLGIALVVHLTLGSWQRTLIALSNIPFALAGGVAGVWFAGGVLSIATTIGFITLFGISMRNGILLLTRVRDLERGDVPTVEAARRAAEERFAPIVMTATTAALGLLPLALSVGMPGSEIQAPMAMVILTGLATSTAMNLLAVPTALVHWKQKNP